MCVAKERKYGAGNLLRVHGRITVYTVVNPLKKCIAALGRPVCAGMPALIVEAAEQCWQMRSDVHSRVTRQTVTQGVQCREQCQKGTLSIMPA